MLLSGEHDDDKDKLGGKEHLNEETLSCVCASAERGRNGHRAWEERRDHAGRCQAAEELSNDNDNGADRRKTSHEIQGDGNLPLVLNVAVS